MKNFSPWDALIYQSDCCLRLEAFFTTTATLLPTWYLHNQLKAFICLIIWIRSVSMMVWDCPYENSSHFPQSLKLSRDSVSPPVSSVSEALLTWQPQDTYCSVALHLTTFNALCLPFLPFLSSFHFQSLHPCFTGTGSSVDPNRCCPPHSSLPFLPEAPSPAFPPTGPRRWETWGFPDSGSTSVVQDP